MVPPSGQGITGKANLQLDGAAAGSAVASAGDVNGDGRGDRAPRPRLRGDGRHASLEFVDHLLPHTQLERFDLPPQGR
jgi:hypothetical protein